MDTEFRGGKFGDRLGAIRPRRGASNSLQHNTFDSNDLPYNQIRAVIVALMFGVIYSD